MLEYLLMFLAVCAFGRLVRRETGMTRADNRIRVQ
jgi:hypothetical protein